MTTEQLRRIVAWWTNGNGGTHVDVQLAIGFALRTLDGRPPLTNHKLAAQCERTLERLLAQMERRAA